MKITKKGEAMIKRMAFTICQKQGWFDGQTFETMQLTDDSQVVIYENAYDTALFSYQYWKKQLEDLNFQIEKLEYRLENAERKLAVHKEKMNDLPPLKNY